MYLFLYRNTDLDYIVYECHINTTAAFQESHQIASFVVVGDLNTHYRDWLNSFSSIDHHCIDVLDFATISGCEKLILGTTHISGNCLDLFLTNSPWVTTAIIGPPIGASVHCFVSIIIKVEQSVLNK